MKIIHINTYSKGGAANAAIRLHEKLLKQNCNSTILSFSNAHNTINAYSVITRKHSYNIIYRIKTRNDFQKKKKILKNKSFNPELFTLPYSVIELSKNKHIQNADIIHLHWVADFINYPDFFKKINKPIVWTLHDMNPFTGGCHYAFDCNNFSSNCENCPQIKGISNQKVAYNVLKVKKKAYSNKKINFICLNEWMMNCLKNSSIFSDNKCTLIPNGLNPEVYKIYCKVNTRKKLGLPTDKKLVLFVADSINNYRKGVKYIIEASKQFNDTKFITVGKGDLKEPNFIHLGEINNEELMAQIYSAADVFVIPSLADNLPNTILESLYCGTPIIGFNVGGIPEMIIHGKNGLICNEISSLALAKLIKEALSVKFDPKFISIDANQRFNLTIQANKYIELYKSLI